MLTKAKNFLSSRKNLLALGTLIPLGGWIYSRIWMVNPAILGDEYLYSMNARKAAPWDPSPAGDFSNYLFNFVYQGTNLCGEAFYTCAKILNLFFFLGFIFTMFIVAIRFMPFWAAYGFMIVAGLSPLSVYTSMFLPESMYMFCIGLLLIAVLHAMKEFTWQNWAIAGAAIGLASLVKPHAWLTFIAVGITLLIVGLGNKALRLRTTALAGASLIAGAAFARISLGLLVAGPKALGFFGVYFGLDTVEEVVSLPGLAGNPSDAENSPISGVLQLFGPQLAVHMLVVSAIMAIAVVSVTVGVFDLIRTKKLTPVTAFALFTFVWLFSLMIEIVVFTGWVTGSGDDHTTRVLLRYYEFLFVIVPLAAISVLHSGVGEKPNVWIRWGLTGVFAALVTPAFTGFFSSLTIQIADAPTLAGLVVNPDVFNGVAVVGFMALVVFAAFPRYAIWTFVALLPFSMVGTGWQIQDQYQTFRGSFSTADKAGQYIRANFSDESSENLWVLANSRFDATNIAFWIDEPNIGYELFAPGTQVSGDLVPVGKRIIVANGDVAIASDYFEEITGDGFTIYIRR